MPKRWPDKKDRVDVPAEVTGLDPTARESFRWTCPFCDLSRHKPLVEGSAEENAVVALRSHIVSSDGGGHGPRYEYPPAFDPATLADHVDAVDGRRAGGGTWG